MKETGATTPTTFVPRDFGAVRKQFGKAAADLVPAEGVDRSGSRFLAAQLQHRVSNAVRESILVSGTNLEQYAESQKSTVPGMSYDRLVRVLRGETLMQLADLVTWAEQFDAVRTLLLTERVWPGPLIQPVVAQPPADR